MKKICKTLVAVSMTLACALPASAQNTASGDTAAANTGTGTTTVQTERDDDRDYGWIRLLGLAGLLGLRRKHDDRHTHTTTTTHR